MHRTRHTGQPHAATQLHQGQTRYKCPPTLLNLVDALLASTPNPIRIVATITPAINPYSRAVTPRRSIFIRSQVVTNNNIAVPAGYQKASQFLPVCPPESSAAGSVNSV